MTEPGRFRIPRSLVMAAALLLPGHALGADVWLEPVRHEAPAYSRVGVRLMVGRQARGKAVPLEPDRMQRFVSLGAEGTADVAGRRGDDPAAMVPLRRGTYLVGYRGHPAWAWMRAERFRALLRVKGLQAVAEQVEGQEPMAHVYSRCAKTVITSGPPGDGFDRPLGLELEIVPERHPLSLPRVKEHLELPVRVLFRGAPLPKVMLTLTNLDRFTGYVKVHADQEGRATLRLPKEGRWLVTGVHALEGEDLAPWQAVWTSLTFSARVRVPPKARQIFARVVARARRSGAIERVLGRHHLTFDRSFYDARGKVQRVENWLMVYDVALDTKAETLTVRVSVSTRDQKNGIRFRYVMGLDGQLRLLTSPTLRSKIVTRDGKVHIDRRGRPETLPYDDRFLPKVVGVFVLPMLFDQGLPDRLPLVDITPFAAIRPPLILRALRPKEPGNAKNMKTYVTEEGRVEPTTRVRVLAGGPRRGLIQQIRTQSITYTRTRPPKERVSVVYVCDRLTPQEFQRRMRAWFPK